MREFEGKTAVVTGGASGMGLAFARRFAAEGMNVVLADIEADALNTQVTRLEQEERNVLGVIVNTMRRETLENLRDEAIDRFGNIHILCNNAGVASLDDAGMASGEILGPWDVPDSTWDWVMGVNFWGVLYGCQVFIPHMLDHGEEGHIVNTASVAGLIPGGGAYGVSKHGVLALTEGIYQSFEDMGAKLSASRPLPRPGQHQHRTRRTEPTLGVRSSRRSQRRGQGRAAVDAERRDGSRAGRRHRVRLDRRTTLLHPASPIVGRLRPGTSRQHPRPRRAADARF